MALVSAFRPRTHSRSEEGATVATVRSLAIVVTATLLATLVTGCGAGPDDEATVATPTVSEAEPSDLGRAPAPAIEGVSLEGDPISLADFRGRPVLINVWSSW
jgi:hypothetical protein